MLSLVSSSTALSSQALSQQLIHEVTYRNRQYRLWESCNQKAYQFHQHQDFKQALNYFLKSLRFG